MLSKVQEFLRVRDRAYLRSDIGVIRSMNHELRRLGVPDDATLTHPTGRPTKGAVAPPAPESKTRAPRQMRCEHDNVAERCEACNPELAAK